MISEKEYLKALETIKQYKKQLRIGVVVRSAVKKTKTVWLDDAWHGIQIGNEDTKADNQFEFAEIVKILLTDKQQKDFTIIDTNREFEVNQKRIDKMFAYINSDKNPWRKQRQHYAQRIRIRLEVYLKRWQITFDKK